MTGFVIAELQNYKFFAVLSGVSVSTRTCTAKPPLSNMCFLCLCMMSISDQRRGVDYSRLKATWNLAKDAGHQKPNERPP